MSEKTGKKERLESEGKPLPWHWLGILSIVVAVLSYMVYIRPDSSSNQCLASTERPLLWANPCLLPHPSPPAPFSSKFRPGLPRNPPSLRCPDAALEAVAIFAAP